MLVLSRRIGEAIVINDQVLVRVAEVRGNRVRLAIAAPAAVAVHREEIQRKLVEFVPVGESVSPAAEEPVAGEPERSAS
jgi:carbon storage regulator